MCADINLLIIRCRNSIQSIYHKFHQDITDMMYRNKIKRYQIYDHIKYFLQFKVDYFDLFSFYFLYVLTQSAEICGLLSSINLLYITIYEELSRTQEIDICSLISFL